MWTGPPPPLPGALPEAMYLAYFLSTVIAVAQETWPRATWMFTGTLAAVRVVPHGVPALGVPASFAAVEPGEPQPAASASRPAARAARLADAASRSLAMSRGRRKPMAVSSPRPSSCP